MDDRIQALLQLDRSSSRFPNRLLDILARREFDEVIESLETNDLVQVVEYLDKALDGLSLAGFPFKQTHRKLQEMCFSRKLLPSSHLLSVGALDVDRRPFTSGGFSDVYKGTYNGLQVCVKRLRVASASDLEQARKMLFRETLPWKRLIHPNIVPLLGVITDPPQIVSELMTQGNLTTYIKSNPQQDLVPLLVDVAKGLNYLHSHSVIHGDLKGPNILVDGSGRARITDFGLAQDTLHAAFVAGGQSARWTAPEVLEETRTPSTEADVFSFGMVMIEAFTGTVPFSDRSSPAAMTAIMRGKRPPRPAHPSLTDGLWELMKQCWDQDRRNRPRMSGALLALDPLIHESTCTSVPSQLATSGRAAPLSTIQRRLGWLNPAGDEYRGLLLELLTHRDLKLHIHTLQGNDLKEFVELLDKALNHFPATDDLFRKALRRLQSTCSNREVLPSSYLIPNELLSRREYASASGGFAGVYEGEFNGQKVCIKTLRSYSQDTRDVTKTAFYRDVVMWKVLHHPNIVPFLGVPTRIPPFEIVCDWMENGRITDYVQRNPQADRIGLLWDVANGLNYLHSYEIIYGDLKGSNILIDTDGHARLTDFGLTSIVRADNSSRSFQDPNMASTITWAAPEILQGGCVSKEGDVFTFAMVAIETFTGRSPLSTNIHSAVYEILRGGRPQRPGTLNHDGLWKLMQRCWNQEPGKRPTTFELLEFFRTSFSGKGGTPKAQDLPIASSTWTLVGPEVHSDRNARPRPDRPRQAAQDFSRAISRALVEIEPNEERRTFILAKITGAQPRDGSLKTVEPKALVETLDKLVQKVNDKAARESCLRVLSEVCRDNVILPESYIISDILPEAKRKTGGVADVWTGILGRGDSVCIKVFRQHPNQQQERIKGVFYYHAIRWKYVSHENVLPFLGISEVVPPFGIVSPGVSNISILQYINDNQDANRLSLLANAASGIGYLHSLDIVHGGINPGNILITGDGTARICDFEIARIIANPVVTEQCTVATCRKGSARYMAPEQVKPKSLGMSNGEAVKESDVYSFAMTAYKVCPFFVGAHDNDRSHPCWKALTGTDPYAEATGDGPLAIVIAEDNHPLRPDDEVAIKWLPDPVWGMLESCWIPQPRSRPSIQRVHQVLQDSVVQPDGQIPKDGRPSDAPKPPIAYGRKPPAKRRFWGNIRDQVQLWLLQR